MAGLHAPLPTLRRAPRGDRRTARGQCGSLDLRCRGLSPPTPCRSPGALPLAKSPEHNLCGKLCSRHGAKLDENRTYTLMNSTIIHNIGCVCRLAVISPTVSAFLFGQMRIHVHPRSGVRSEKEAAAVTMQYAVGIRVGSKA